jgi:hypothetical protein
MGDTSGCQISQNNLAVYLQGVTVTPSSNLTSEYFVTASLPSSASTKRVWQFTTQGKVTGPDTATLTLDYTQAHENCPDYNITFEGALNGSLTVHNQVFSANKYMSYKLVSTYVLEISVKVPKNILKCYGTTPQAYYFNVNINDGTCKTICACQSSVTYNNITYDSSNSTIKCANGTGDDCESVTYTIIPSGETCTVTLVTAYPNCTDDFTCSGSDGLCDDRCNA